MGLVTLIGFPLVGWLILYFFSDIPLFSMFLHGEKYLYQIAIGVLYGLISGFIAWKIVCMDFMQVTRESYIRTISEMELSQIEIVFISFCAGFGEEILFRGVIQYFIGIIPCAILFVAIHGYLHPKKWQISVYGTYMIVVIIGMGYLFDYVGIVTVITAHFIIDLFLLSRISNYR